LELSEEIGRKKSISSGHLGLCKISLKRQNYALALYHGEMAYNTAVEIEQIELIKNTSNTLSKVYAQTGNFKKAYMYHLEFKKQSDSLINEKNIKKITALEYEYRYDQELRVTKLEQQKKEAVLKEKSKRERILRYSLTAGIMLLLVIVFIIWKNLIGKRKSNNLLVQQKEEIQNMNEELRNTLTILKDTQSRLVESEKMASVGVLSAGIAHEINNPLNFIQGGMFSMKSFIESEMPEKMPEFEKMFAFINEGIERASSIISGLNQFTNKSDSNNDRCDLHTIIDNCLSVLRNMYEGSIEIRKEYSSEDLIITGNESRLHQLIMNILLNALQATEKNGTLRIVSSTNQNKIHIELSDTGHGIKKEYLDKVTEPFFTTKEPGEGVGLGLSIAYNIVKEHDGFLTIDSEENKGTKVTVVFPVE
jgi:signal transduction histidine kinase